MGAKMGCEEGGSVGATGAKGVSVVGCDEVGCEVGRSEGPKVGKVVGCEVGALVIGAYSY